MHYDPDWPAAYNVCPTILQWTMASRGAKIVCSYQADFRELTKELANGYCYNEPATVWRYPRSCAHLSNTKYQRLVSNDSNDSFDS